MGPFTSALLVVIFIFGAVMIILAPWGLMYEMWKHRDGNFMAWVLCIAWAVGGLAVTMDIVWEAMK